MNIPEGTLTQEAVEQAMDLFIGRAPTSEGDPVLWAARKALDYLRRRQVVAAKVLDEYRVKQRANAKLIALRQEREAACLEDMSLDEAARKITGESRVLRAKHNLKRWLTFSLRHWLEWKQRSVVGQDLAGRELRLGPVIVSSNPEAPSEIIAAGPVEVARWIKEQGVIGISLWRTQQQAKAVEAIQDASSKDEVAAAARLMEASEEHESAIEKIIAKTVSEFFETYSTCQMPGHLIRDLRESFNQEKAAFQIARARADGKDGYIRKVSKKA